MDVACDVNVTLALGPAFDEPYADVVYLLGKSRRLRKHITQLKVEKVHAKADRREALLLGPSGSPTAPGGRTILEHLELPTRPAKRASAPPQHRGVSARPQWSASPSPGLTPEGARPEQAYAQRGLHRLYTGRAHSSAALLARAAPALTLHRLPIRLCVRTERLQEDAGAAGRVPGWPTSCTT